MQYAQVPGGNRNNMKGYIFIDYEPIDANVAAEALKTTAEMLYQAMITSEDFCKELGITGWLVLLE